jgi:hypothetical protein
LKKTDIQNGKGEQTHLPVLPLTTPHPKEIAVTGKDPDALPDLKPYMRKLLAMPKETALEMLEEYALEQFEMLFGTRIITLEISVEQAETEIKKGKEHLAKLEKTLSGIERSVKHSALMNDTQSNVPLGARLQFYKDGRVNWTLARDGGIVVGALSGMAALLAMASLNVFSNLMNSGSMMFLDHPWIAASLSVLPAIATFSVKYLGQLLPDKVKKHYGLALHGAAVVSLLIWVVTFAFQFHNNAGGELNLDMVAASTAPDFAVAYTIAQLLTEILVAACLFTACEDIYQKYASEELVENPSYTLAHQQYLEAKNHLHQLQEKLKADSGELKKLIAKRKIFVSENILTYLNLITP